MPVARVLLCALLALLALSASAQSACNYPGSFTVAGGNSNGTIGCTGYVAGTFDWYFDGLSTCVLTLTSNLPGGATVTYLSGYTKLPSTNGPTTINGAHVNFVTSYAYTGYGFKVAYTCTAVKTDNPIQQLTSKQSVYVANKTHGGFVYVSLGKQVDGSSQSYNLQLTSYKGLKPPSFFVGYNRVPTLESYDWTNTTAADGNGGFVWNFLQNSPRSGTYVIGMFLYGTFGGVYAKSAWNFNYEVVPFGNPLTKTGVTKTWCGQFQLDLKAKSFTLQVSRETPGGFPIFYVGKGYRPTAALSDYVLDTNKDSFQELNVKAPVNADGPNPGLWVVCTQEAFSGAFVLGVTPA